MRARHASLSLSSQQYGEEGTWAADICPRSVVAVAPAGSFRGFCGGGSIEGGGGSVDDMAEGWGSLTTARGVRDSRRAAAANNLENGPGEIVVVEPIGRGILFSPTPCCRGIMRRN